MIKSPAEIALMQRANDITIEVYKAAFAALREEMTQFDFGRNVRAAFTRWRARRVGGRAVRRVTAFPHGSIQPQRLKPGDVVLVDGGCRIEGLSVGHHPHDGVRQAVERQIESGISRSRRRRRRSWRRRSAQRANRWMPRRAR